MLNAAQVARRLGFLGGSDMKCIMDGDRDKIHRLWRVKIGEEIGDDLSDVWPVRLGECTEQLNIAWYELKHKQPVSRRGDIAKHPWLPWAGCTLDGWIDALECPLECKHVGGREPLEVIIARYQPQLQWQCEVTRSDQVVLSVIMAASEPVVEFIDRDPHYAGIMVERGAQFWGHVENRTPPVDMPAVPPPIEAHVEYDFTGRNEWASSASQWLESKDAADMHNDAAKILKALVPPDAKKCIGHGVYIVRDRAGRLSLRELTE